MSFATARLAISTADQQIDPAALPAAAQDFYAEPVELTGGVNFAGTLDLTGRLADAFGYAGYAGEVDARRLARRLGRRALRPRLTRSSATCA